MTTELDSNQMMHGGHYNNGSGSSDKSHTLKDAQRLHRDDLDGVIRQNDITGGGVNSKPKKNNSEVVEYVSSDDPPPIPHVEVNQVPLTMSIRNLTVYTVTELSQFMKTNVHSNPGKLTSMKKLKFLQLIIFLRNQFLKLYVLLKWCRTIKNNNFHTMIDVLNWFRVTNATVNNCIWALRNNLTAMSNAKLPNVDLVTALEVLSLGRTNLPTHNFKISGEQEVSEQPTNGVETIPTRLILQRLKDLNLGVSLKMALVEVPEQFHDYTIKNGRIYITVQEQFEIQLATIDCHSPLFFVDLKFLFVSHMLPLNKARIEKVINEILYKSNKPLVSLYNFLHKYVLTLQLYMVHTELLKLESSGKFSGGNLLHRYDSKRSRISIKYWIHSKMGQKATITIGVDRRTRNLILKWNNPMANQSRIPTVYSDILQNLEAILDEIMFNHSHIIKADLLAKDVFQEDEENPDVLLFQIPTTCISMAPVQLKIDLITGVFYFRNPTALLSKYVSRINRAENADELTRVLQRLKLEKITHALRNMFEKTGWVCSKVIKLDQPIISQQHVEVAYANSSDLLQDDIFTRLPSWLANWYLILTVVSSNKSCIIEKRVGKVISVRGKWELSYLSNTGVTSAKLESITYQKVLHLQKAIFHKIINHTLIDSLNQLKIRNTACRVDALSSPLPEYITCPVKPSNELNGSALPTSTNKTQPGADNTSTPIITLELESFLEGSKALNDILESSMFMKFDYINSEIHLFAKFKRNTMMIKCTCDELLIHFVPKDPLTFYLSENFTNLNDIIQCLTKFRKKLMQLVVLTDVVERLHKNFASENFRIVALKPNEVSFKYLVHSSDDRDCTISIKTNEQTVEKLEVKLSPGNPQYIVQPFIDNEGLDCQFIFNYLQFTSSLFTTLKVILSEDKENSECFTMINLGLHNLREYQLLYHNPESGTKITLIIELKGVFHNGRNKTQFYVHFSDEEHISTKSLAYPLVHQVRNQIFMLDTKEALASNREIKYRNAIKLGDGIACDPSDIGPVLQEIHSILKTDSNITYENDSRTTLNAAPVAGSNKFKSNSNSTLTSNVNGTGIENGDSKVTPITASWDFSSPASASRGTRGTLVPKTDKMRDERE
ncbi:hypothetical protein HG535_0D06030 [Zygotorulaspora mrakii]|uniref:Mediator of RNA polymerase II transcription subunit 14 n=1 Tax=Zygotorulaspora mrakii TaxID=42260 RepID=A0A7H9B3B6_ZYGMR|nr:uncharacterized protein HG535_0D06030 [Zygotorulaspora mrakii]QLG72894.1 hypothetical protein HG535_0D06030 [Zygotorulaspora mrakii]